MQIEMYILFENMHANLWMSLLANNARLFDYSGSAGFVIDNMRFIGVHVLDVLE